MRIGILTFHQSVNNGAVMQAYSLSRKIKELYPTCEVEIVDYRMKKVQAGYSYTLRSYLGHAPLSKRIRKCLYLIRHPMFLWRMQHRTEVFRFCLNKLPLSPKCILSDIPSEVYAYINERYDILVVGSDAVWNYLSRGFGNAYLPSHAVTCKKMSYAASCYGMNFLNRPEQERKAIGDTLEDFSFIGVRDDATEDFVQWSGCHMIPVHTCDPTAFLDVNDLPIDEEKLYQKLKKKGFDFSKPTIGMMGTTCMLKMIRRMYGKQYQIAALYEYTPGADINLYDLEPYEWAYVFRYFKVTFTTYFHGTMLSLRNGIPVICIALETEFAKIHTPKTLDVLTRLGFEEWYFKTDYRTENIEAIKQQADKFLANNFRKQILAAIDKEAESYNAFQDALEELIRHI
ncbi:MAG: polysaccharide pyruvyl transferase family protein [Ruminococcaceae bacterium]|nr:polysaccharide pyruvyl transferase family protein [Oscillospiraceae bacterium]